MKFKKAAVGLILCSQMFLGCSGGGDQNTYTGIVEGTTVQVPAMTGGKIENLLTDVGEAVDAGQIIARIDTSELHLQLMQVLASRDELLAQEDLATTQLKSARKDENHLRQKFGRFKELLQSQSVNQQAVDDLENQLLRAEAGRKKAEQQFAAIAARKKQISAQENLLLKKISDATVVTPISGIVSSKYFEAGEAIPPLNPLVEVIDLQEVWVKIYLNETELSQIKIGNTVAVMADGVSEDIPGKISWISPRAEFTPKTILTPETRTSLVFAVKITIENPEQLLKQGMPVEVRL